MKTSLRIGIRILILIFITLTLYLFSYGIFKIALITLEKIPFLQGKIPREVIRNSATLCSVLAVGYFLFVTIIKPMIFIILWIQALSKGIYQVPEKLNLLGKGKKGINQCIKFMYKEVISQMALLESELKKGEVQRLVLEKDRREWLAGITHDLKTPLSYIQGYATMISAEQYQWTESEVKDFGKKIEEKSAHIKSLIDDLNISFQSEDGKVLIQKKQIEIVSFIQKVVLDIANSPMAIPYVFSYETKSESCLVDIDPILFQRALQNILTNAIVHNPPQTQIRVVVRKEKQTFCVQIEDNGKGMEKETKDNLFQSYYRGTPTDESIEGSGLGMAIAKQFVELHEGKIQVESTIGQGSTILIKLPIENNSAYK